MIAVDSVYDEVVSALERHGGLLLDKAGAEKLQSIHWHDGKMTTTLLAQDIETVLDAMALTATAPDGTNFPVAPQEHIIVQPTATARGRLR